MTYIIDYDIESSLIENFKNDVDRLKEKKQLCNFLKDEQLFERLLRSVRNSDILHLLTKIDEVTELQSMCQNSCLIQHILENFLLNLHTVELYNTLVQNCEEYRAKNFQSIFDVFEDFLRSSASSQSSALLPLNTLNAKIYPYNTLVFTLEEKKEIYEVFKDDGRALKKLKHLVKNNLENTFDFESLKKYMKGGQ